MKETKKPWLISLMTVVILSLSICTVVSYAAGMPDDNTLRLCPECAGTLPNGPVIPVTPVIGESIDEAGIPIWMDSYLTSSEVEVFKITVKEPVLLVVQTLGQLDTVGTLLDHAGMNIATDDDSGYGLNFKIKHPLTDGYYFVHIRTYQGDEGPYTLVANRSDH